MHQVTAWSSYVKKDRGIIFEETDNIACAILDTVPIDLEIRWVQPMPPINLLKQKRFIEWYITWACFALLIKKKLKL